MSQSPAIGVPALKMAVPAIYTLTWLGAKSAPLRPRAATMRPQFGSRPYRAVLNSDKGNLFTYNFTGSRRIQDITSMNRYELAKKDLYMIILKQDEKSALVYLFRYNSLKEDGK